MKLKMKPEIANDFLISFGENITKIRKDKKMSQIKLAQRCNVSVALLSRAERGLFNIKITSLLVLANGLDVPVEKLFDFKGIDDFVKNLY